MGVNISDQTVRNRLRAGNLRSRRPTVRTTLTQCHRRARRDRCHQHIQWTRQQWSRVLFSSESGFNLHFNDGRTRVYRRQEERFSDATVSEYERFGGGLVVVWAGVTMNQRTRLFIVDGNLNAQRSVDNILQPVVVPFHGRMNQGAVLQDDNAQPHRGRIVNEFVQQFNIRRLDWPANSPYLNPIEHIWDDLGRRVYRHNPPKTLVQLRQRLIQVEQHPRETIRRCVQSMRKCCQACLNAHEGHTRY